jgi:hypothetical protein
MTPQARLQKIEHLRQQQTLLADKRHALKKALIVETQADEKFRFRRRKTGRKPTQDCLKRKFLGSGVHVVT